jgi:hypothetical protein
MLTLMTDVFILFVEIYKNVSVAILWLPGKCSAILDSDDWQFRLKYALLGLD